MTLIFYSSLAVSFCDATTGAILLQNVGGKVGVKPIYYET